MIDREKDGQFHPDRPVTRAEFAAMLSRFLALPMDISYSDFNDVEEHDRYAPSVFAAERTGMMRGVAFDRFDPEGPVTREQLAVMIVRAHRYSHPLEPIPETTVTFKDARETSRWAEYSVRQAASLQLMEGKEDERFMPKQFATRAEAVAVLSRLTEGRKNGSSFLEGSLDEVSFVDREGRKIRLSMTEAEMRELRIDANDKEGYRTSGGVAPGSMREEVSAAHGPATFTYSSVDVYTYLVDERAETALFLPDSAALARVFDTYRLYSIEFRYDSEKQAKVESIRAIRYGDMGSIKDPAAEREKRILSRLKANPDAQTEFLALFNEDLELLLNTYILYTADNDRELASNVRAGLQTWSILEDLIYGSDGIDDSFRLAMLDYVREGSELFGRIAEIGMDDDETTRRLYHFQRTFADFAARYQLDFYDSVIATYMTVYRIPPGEDPGPLADDAVDPAEEERVMDFLSEVGNDEQLNFPANQFVMGYSEAPYYRNFGKSSLLTFLPAERTDLREAKVHFLTTDQAAAEAEYRIVGDFFQAGVTLRFALAKEAGDWKLSDVNFRDWTFGFDKDAAEAEADRLTKERSEVTETVLAQLRAYYEAQAGTDPDAVLEKISPVFLDEWRASTGLDYDEVVKARMDRTDRVFQAESLKDAMIVYADERQSVIFARVQVDEGMEDDRRSYTKELLIIMDAAPGGEWLYYSEFIAESE